MLKTEGLQYAYPYGEALSFPDINSEDHAPLLLLGNSGCGKTTLLHLMAGLLTPAAGHVTIGNTNLGQLKGNDLDKFRGKHIGLIFQQNHFIESLSVLENIALAANLNGITSDKSAVIQLLDQLGIASKANKRPDQLSQGERQRVAIIRAVANKPSIVFADEPTSALDDHHCKQVMSLLQNVAATSGSKLVIVTHDTRLKSSHQGEVIQL